MVGWFPIRDISSAVSRQMALELADLPVGGRTVDWLRP